MLKNSGLGSEIAASMDQILQDPKFNAVFETKSYDDALSQDSSYKAFVRIASKKCEVCEEAPCICKEDATKSSKTKSSKTKASKTDKTDKTAKAEAMQYILNNLITTSTVLENMGLYRSASIILASAEGIIREASIEEDINIEDLDGPSILDEDIEVDDLDKDDLDKDLLIEESDIPTDDDLSELPDDLSAIASKQLEEIGKVLKQAGLHKSASISLGLSIGVRKEAQSLFDQLPEDEEPKLDSQDESNIDSDSSPAEIFDIDPDAELDAAKEDESLQDFEDEDEDDLFGSETEFEGEPVDPDRERFGADADDKAFDDDKDEKTEEDEEEEEETEEEEEEEEKTEPSKSDEDDEDEDKNDASCSTMVKDKTVVAAYNDLLKWIQK